MGESTRQGAEVLTARNLGKQFFRKSRESARTFDAVLPCDLTLHAGELVSLMGRSGSGKSTLLNMLAGLLEPTSGAVEFRGKSLYELGDAELSRLRNASFGVVPQGQTALQSLTVVQNILLPSGLYGAAADEGLALSLLDRVGIANLADCYPRELSGGELRRMAIVRALICDPAVVFADEPTSDLDDENTDIVLKVLREAADAGAAVFMVTHEQQAESVADTTLRMDAGRTS